VSKSISEASEKPLEIGGNQTSYKAKPYAKIPYTVTPYSATPYTANPNTGSTHTSKSPPQTQYSEAVPVFQAMLIYNQIINNQNINNFINKSLYQSIANIFFRI
jgi:hypothetical protein